MEQVTDNIHEQIANLAANAFSAFYEDIGGIFDTTSVCTRLYAQTGRMIDLKPDFNKYISIHRIRSKGALQGTFDLVFDRTGTFVLAGIFMMLPEKRVLEYIRGGKNSDGELIANAVRETGNMLVGSWDRVFRQAMQDHEHFTQEDNCIGDPWQKPKEYFTCPPETDCCYAVCQITVQPYPAFKCAAVFPLSVLHDVSARVNAPGKEPDTSELLQSPISLDIHSASEDAFFASNDSLESPLITEPDPEPELPQDRISNADKNVQTVSQTMNESTPDIVQNEAISTVPENASEDKAVLGQPGPVRQAIDELTRTEDETHAPLLTNAESLTARHMMRPAIMWADPEETVEQVINKMQQHEAGYVLVGRDGQIQGIVSRSDTAAAVSPYLRSVFAHMKRPLDDASLQIRIKWFMSKPVHTIAPDAGLEQVINSMIKYGVRGLPVVDCKGDVLGLITAFDLMQALLAKINRS